MAKVKETPVRQSAKSAARGAFPQQRLLAFPEIQRLLIPPPYQQCLETIIPHFLFPPELEELFIPSDTMELQVRKLHLAFKLIPEHYEKFIALVKAQREKDEQTLTKEAAIRAYGLDQTRTFIFAIFITQSVLNKPFLWDTQGARPKVDPKSIMQYTLRVLDSYRGREVNLAFAAGLPFDILSLIARKHCAQPKPVLEFIQALAARGIETARIGIAVGRRSRDLKLSNYMYSVCILQYLGEAILAVLDPEYVKFHGKMTKDDLTNSARKICEEKRFGISSDRLGALVCRYFELFQPVADVILYRKQPFVHQASGDKDLYNLSAACCLATYIAARPLELFGEDDSRMNERWLRPELGDSPFGPEQVFNALEHLGEESEEEE